MATALRRDQLTNGQLYLLLSLARLVYRDLSLAKPLPGFFRSHWHSAPYHLRLDMLDAAYRCGWANENDRNAIVAILKELPDPQNLGLSSALIDALKSLGAMESEEAEQLGSIKAKISLALAEPDAPDMQALAAHIWYARFDHPHEGAFNQAVSGLADEHRKALMVMATKGTDKHSTWFLAILLIELSAFNNASIADVMGRFASLPEVKTAFPQDAIRAFAVAHIALGRLGVN